MRPVVISGVGMIPFERRDEDSLVDMMAMAGIRAIDNAGLDVHHPVDAVYVGNMASGLFNHQVSVASALVDRLSLFPAAAERVENGPASGGSAIKNGFLAVHEMTWLKDNPPKEISDYWEKVYPAIATIEKNLEIIKKRNYKLIGYFPLPEDAWWDLYYNPLQVRLNKLRSKYKDNQEAIDMINEEQKEIDLFKKYNEWYGSVFYVMQK